MRLLLPITLLTGLAACSLVLGDGHKAELEAPVSFDAAGASGIRIEGINGRVVVEAGAEGAVAGTSKYYAKAATAEAASERVGQRAWDAELQGSTLVVKLRRPDDERREFGAALTLTVPASWSVDTDTSNGGVTVRGDFPQVLVATSNGRISLDGAGTVRARTSNGRIEYQGSSPDFDLRTSNGRVNVVLAGDWSGKGRVKTSNGSVDVECTGTLAASVRMSTSNGKARAMDDITGPGTLTIETSNGSIDVRHAVAGAAGNSTATR